MYGSVERGVSYISDLSDFIRSKYNLEPTGITPAKRGYYGETWRLETAGGSFFLKLDYSDAHKGIYERSFPVVEYLCGHGIDFISRIRKTAGGGLSVRYDGSVLGVFDWVDGENIENDGTKIPEFQMLAKIYTVPSDGLAITTEDFSGRSAERFFSQWDALPHEDIHSLFEKHRAKLEYRAERLKHFTKLCRNSNDGFFITHGDAGGNIIVNRDKYTIVDWATKLLQQI